MCVAHPQETDDMGRMIELDGKNKVNIGNTYAYVASEVLNMGRPDYDGYWGCIYIDCIDGHISMTIENDYKLYPQLMVA
jgi:hypothetical protein